MSYGPNLELFIEFPEDYFEYPEEIKDYKPELISARMYYSINRGYISSIDHAVYGGTYSPNGEDIDDVIRRSKSEIVHVLKEYDKNFDRDKRKRESTTIATVNTKKCQENIDELNNVLISGIEDKPFLDWNGLKGIKKFGKEKPIIPEKITLENYSKKLTKPRIIEIPPEPNRNSEKYSIDDSLSFKDIILRSRYKKKLEELENLYQGDYDIWVGEKEKILSIYNQNLEVYNSRNNEIEIKIDNINKQNNQKYLQELDSWEKENENFCKEQEYISTNLEDLKQKYLHQDSEGVCFYCSQILKQSKYPDYISKEFELEYNPENKTLIVDYSLPLIDDIPHVSEVKYVISRNTFNEKNLSKSELNRLYDHSIYSIILRSLFELYDSDKPDFVKSIVFNGWVNSIDKATGKDKTSCIASIQTTKSEFLGYNLEYVDSKECFKSLKGICSSKLHTLTPIAPIIKIDRNDKRFVDSYDVAESIDNSTNLASMDWKDFEHLIRELFEKEFSVNGGEVKITQASRDGGVDAIAFDPDPIRGGKIVIQAKRYTNTVGVSAVRDLFGTIHNEGAMKGILVTTADYGPDAYNFAKDKPITLLNGNNLLHLIGKHGRKAKIDLIEAKKNMK